MNIDISEDCDGFDVKVVIIQGNEKCIVKPKDVYKGINAYWIGELLGNCTDYKFNSQENLLIAVQSDNVGRFCPLSVKLTMTNMEGIETKFCSKMNASIWYTNATNERYHAVYKGDCPLEGKYTCIKSLE